MELLTLRISLKSLREKSVYLIKTKKILGRQKLLFLNQALNLVDKLVSPEIIGYTFLDNGITEGYFE